MLNIPIRPITSWPGKETGEPRYSTFRKTCEASLVICAWGRDGVFMGRGSSVRRKVARFDPHYLRLTREQPWHPLYLPDQTQPSRWYSEGFSNKNNKGDLI